MIYINMRQDNTVETVDQFETRKEAREMLTEYQMAFPQELWISNRATKEWRDDQ